jgi:broad specificity phosphatase PhoE
MKKKTKKTLYIIRHGESEDNSLPIFQYPTSRLTAKGEKTAHLLAGRISKLPIDLIVSSTLRRAKQTTEIINDRVKKETVYDDMFVEIKKPSELWGKEKESGEAKQIMEQIEAHKYEKDWRYSDEENFADRKARAQQIMKFLQERTQEHILVSTHGGLIKTIVALLLFGDEMTPAEYYRFLAFTNLKNTGITVCKQLLDDRWKLTTWNDLAHLEDLEI